RALHRRYRGRNQDRAPELQQRSGGSLNSPEGVGGTLPPLFYGKEPCTWHITLTQMTVTTLSTLPILSQVSPPRKPICRKLRYIMPSPLTWAHTLTTTSPRTWRSPQAPLCSS